MTDDYDDHLTLAAELRTWAAGSYRDEAAVELLIAHRTWLARRDFRRACLSADGGYAWLDADRAARIADGDETVGLPASSSELRVLAIVLDAIAHAAGWHETGHTHLVTGYPEVRQ